MIKCRDRKSYRRLINGKTLDFAFHMSLATFWPAVILYFKTFDTDGLSDALVVQADFVMWMFILSFGFGTLVRNLTYKSSVLEYQTLIETSHIINLCAAFVALIYTTTITMVIYFSTILNCLIVYINLSVASGKSSTLRIYVPVYILLSIYGFVVVINTDILLATLTSLINIFIFTYRYGYVMRKKLDNLYVCCNRMCKILFSGILLMVKMLPLRLAIYNATLYFTSNQENQYVDIYANIILAWGLLAVITGRVVLFLEKRFKEDFSRLLRYLSLYAITVSACLSIYYLHEFGLTLTLFTVFFTSLLYGLRESYGVIVGFFDNAISNCYAMICMFFASFFFLMLQFQSDAIYIIHIFYILQVIAITAITVGIACFADKATKILKL